MKPIDAKVNQAFFDKSSQNRAFERWGLVEEKQYCIEHFGWILPPPSLRASPHVKSVSDSFGGGWVCLGGLGGRQGGRGVRRRLIEYGYGLR